MPQRRYRITIRFSADERTAIDGAARRSGLTLSAWARRVLLAAKPGRAARRPAIEASLLVSLLDRLGRAAAQLAHITSAMRSARFEAMPATERDLSKALRDLRALRPAILRALGKRSGGP
jgi:uncharacterized protein (DUF1778 family)